MKLNHYIKAADSKEHKNITWKGLRIKNLEGLYFISNKRIKRKKKTEQVIFFLKKADVLAILFHFHNFWFLSHSTISTES